MEVVTLEILKLIKWIESQDYSINLRGRKHEARHGVKVININWQATGYKQLFTILHECGHIMERKDPIPFMNKFPGLLQSYVNPQKERNINYTIDTIREEVNAWENGLKLAHTLELPINEREYWSFANKCLMSYLRWGVNKHENLNNIKTNGI